MDRILNPKNDFAFKKVFGEVKHKDILIAFLNDIFEGVQEKIEDVEFLKLHQDPEVAAYRQSIVDVKCSDTHGRQFIVEMQCASNSAFIKRACVYVARAYVGQVTEGVKYKDVRPVIFLAILDFKLFPDKKAYLSHHKVKDITTGEVDIKELSFSFLELQKLNKTFEESKTMLEKWVYFFKNATETTPDEIKKIERGYPILGEAYSALAHHAFTQEQLDEYYGYEMKADEINTRMSDAERKGRAEGELKGKAEGLAEGELRGKAVGLAEGELKGRAAGLAEGLAEGELRNAIDTAVKMLHREMSVDDISEITGLSIHKIKELKKKNREK